MPAMLGTTRGYITFRECTLQGTNISPKNWHFEDDFPFPKVGYVNSLQCNHLGGFCILVTGGKPRIPKVKFGKFQARSPRLSLSSSMSASLGIDSKMDGFMAGPWSAKPIRSWWLKSGKLTCWGWYVIPIIYRVVIHPNGGCLGFLPSTVKDAFMAMLLRSLRIPKDPQNWLFWRPYPCVIQVRSTPSIGGSFRSLGYTICTFELFMEKHHSPVIYVYICINK